MGFPEEFIKFISIGNRDVSSEGLKGIGLFIMCILLRRNFTLRCGSSGRVVGASSRRGADVGTAASAAARADETTQAQGPPRSTTWAADHRGRHWFKCAAFAAA